jgi:transcriptional regulator with XRE-family HTH domain
MRKALANNFTGCYTENKVNPFIFPYFHGATTDFNQPLRNSTSLFLPNFPFWFILKSPINKKENPTMTLGQRIAFYRKKQSLTQAGVGEQLNISAQAISKWENDQAEPDVATLIQLSKILNVPLDELLTGEVPTPAAPATTEAPAPQKEKKPSVIKKALKATAAFICKFKKILIPAVCLVLVVTTLLIVAPLTFMQPCSKWGYNRIEAGMDIAKVEQMLGAPHKKNITKTLVKKKTYGKSIADICIL